MYKHTKFSHVGYQALQIHYTWSLNCLIVLLTRVPGNLQAAHFVFHVVDL